MLLKFFYTVLLHVLFFNCCFLDADILLGSVAIHFWCGGIFSHNFTTNVIFTVKEF